MPSLPPPFLELAAGWCVICNGTGLVGRDPPQACECIYRVIFRICYGQFRTCRLSARSTQCMPLERRSTPTGNRHTTWVRRNEDYCADFEMAARLALTPELHRLFQRHYLVGAPVRLLSDRLGVHRNVVARGLRSIQTCIGRQIAGSAPHSIYPPSEYMRTGPTLEV